MAGVASSARALRNVGIGLVVAGIVVETCLYDGTKEFVNLSTIRITHRYF